MASLRLSITGMTCGHCRMTVEKAIRSVAGVSGAAVDLHGGAAEVDFDEGRVDGARIVAAIQAAGYRAQVEQAA